jgi:hypothetical protein
MVSGWAAGVRFLWRKQGVSPLPLSIGEVMSLHPRKDTTRNRVCKHALASILVSQEVCFVPQRMRTCLRKPLFDAPPGKRFEEASNPR